MPIARLVNGKTDYGAEPPTLDLRPVGSTGVRDYEIDTPDIEAAAIATDLPTFGTSWGESLVTLTAQNIKIKRVNSHPVSGGDSVGRCWARVSYEAPGLVNSTSAGYPGLKYSRITAATASILQRADIRLTPTNASTVNILTDPFDGQTIEERYGQKIDNTRGVSRDVGYTEVEVTRFMAASDLTTSLQAKLEFLQSYQMTNSDEVTIPTIVGTATTRTYAARRLRFHQYAISGDGAVTRLTIRLLAAAVDHDYRWLLVDEFLNPFPEALRQRSRLYDVAAFMTSPALW